MSETSAYELLCSSVLFAAFLVDTWYTVTKSDHGYEDSVSTLGFYKNRPWARTFIKLPIILWFGSLGLGLLDVAPGAKFDILCWIYALLVAWSIWKMHRRLRNKQVHQ